MISVQRFYVGKVPVAAPGGKEGEFAAQLRELKARVDYLESRLSDLDGGDLDITEPDAHYTWGTNNAQLVEPYRGGFVAIKLPQGLVAGGRTLEEFEAQMRALDPQVANDLYVASADVFL